MLNFKKGRGTNGDDFLESGGENFHLSAGAFLEETAGMGEGGASRIRKLGPGEGVVGPRGFAGLGPRVAWGLVTCFTATTVHMITL